MSRVPSLPGAASMITIERRQKLRTTATQHARPQLTAEADRNEQRPEGTCAYHDPRSRNDEYAPAESS